jgi:hypothetical protein
MTDEIDTKRVGVGSNFHLGTSGESPSETAARVTAAKRKKRTAPRVDTDAGRTLGHMNPRGKSAELESGYAKAIEALVEEKVAAVSPRRMETARGTDVKTYSSVEEIEAAMQGRPIFKPQGPAPRRWHRY